MCMLCSYVSGCSSVYTFCPRVLCIYGISSMLSPFSSMFKLCFFSLFCIHFIYNVLLAPWPKLYPFVSSFDIECHRFNSGNLFAAPFYQMQQYYRVGKLDDCTKKFSDLFDCLSLKTKRASEVEVCSFILQLVYSSLLLSISIIYWISHRLV